MVNFAFDSRNRLIQAGSTTYRYDAENQRVGVNQTQFVVKSQPALSQVLVKTEANGKKTFYVYGLGLIGEETGGEYTSYHFDLRGSSVALSDASGPVIERFQYSPYGVLLGGDAEKTPFLFNGMYGVMTDGNGLYYMRARYYHPEIRRFVNQDVLRGRVVEGQTLNRYAYVNGDPIKYTDPYGLDRMCGGGERAVPCPEQPHVYTCVKDSREPMKVCAGRNDEYGCMSKGAHHGGNNEGPNPYGGFGTYVDFHLLLFGLSSEISVVSQGEKTCIIRTDCGGIGLGLYGGAGVTIPIGIALDHIDESLAGYSAGLSLDLGACWIATGYSGNFGFNDDGITSIGSSKGFKRDGVGCGFSLTVDFCEAFILWCNKP